MSVILKADLDLLYDLAGNSKKTVAPDVVDYIENNPDIVSLLRAAKSNKLGNDEIKELEKKINKFKTKALIVAAGLGSRLKNHTENLPKCMLDFGGKTLLQRQTQAYKDCGLDGVFISVTIASAFTTFSVLLTSLRYIRFKFKNKIVKSLLRFGLPFLPAGLSTIAMESLDRYLLSVLTNADTVGIYSVGYKLGIFMLLITTAFQYAWQPFFLKSGNHPESKDLFATIFNYFMVVTTFAWLLITLFLPEIINFKIGKFWLIGPEFHEAKTIVPIILMAYLFQGAYLNFLPGIYFKEKTHYIPLITGVGALVNLVINLILIPVYGMFGAAFATLIGHGTIAIVTFFVARRMFPVPYDWLKILRLTTSLFFTLLSAYLLNFTIMGRVLGLILFGLGLIIFRVIYIKEINNILIK